jgi:predicted Zn finger-like uncharacterized protein
MKITCQACQAKYTIADEKVSGKIVKIRCKKCSATIVVNGNDPSASAGAAGGAAHAFDYAGQGAGNPEWTVNVADGDQRTMTQDEFVNAYHAGVVTDETFCWKDGMGDWLPVREIDDLYAACTATRAMVGGAEQEEGVTKIQDTGGAMFGAAPGPAPGPAFAVPRPAAGAAPGLSGGAPAPSGAGNGAGAFAPAAAARRAGARAPAVDLFSGAAQAGGEEDVMTSAPTGVPQAHEGDAALTGARNENSVLFSLSALTSKGGGPEKPSVGEASGLIDIRQLSNVRPNTEDAKKKSRIDDIMNLAGGGAFSPALAAPVLSAPPIEEYAPAPENPMGAMAAGSMPQPKSKGVIFAAVGGGVLLVAAAVVVAVVLMRKEPATADKDHAATSASVAAAVPTDTGSVAMNAPPATPTDTGSANGGAPAPTDSSPASTKDSSKTTKTAPTTTSATTVAAATTTTAAPTTKPPDTAAATAPAAGGSDQPFNMGEAKAKLGAIASGVQSCKRGDTTGSGRVVVTFAPSGGAQSAVVSGAPFEGTPTGSCVAGRFRGARVPPFSGSPFSVSKSFSIN